MKKILTLVFIATLSLSANAQDASGIQMKHSHDQIFSYAYITVQGKFLSNKLKVEVDLGELPEQIKESEDYSKILTNKKSFAAILNYMAENHYELVETLDNLYPNQGTGGIAGIVFIMKKKN